MSDYLAPSLNGFVFDGTTLDADDIAASCSQLDGWFDSADMRSALYDRAMTGQGLTVLRRNARGITLSGFLHRAVASDPLGIPGYRALRNVKRLIGSSLSSVLLSVPEDVDVPLALTARVNQVGAIRTKLDVTGGVLASIVFQIPLLAQDPRRYDAVVKSLDIDGSDIVTNGGDVPAPLRVTWPPGTTTASVQNNSLLDDPILTWVGAASAGDLVIDTGAFTVTDDGANAIEGLTVANWFQLQTGDNDIDVSPGGTVTWQDAYS